MGNVARLVDGVKVGEYRDTAWFLPTQDEWTRWRAWAWVEWYGTTQSARDNVLRTFDYLFSFTSAEVNVRCFSVRLSDMPDGWCLEFSYTGWLQGIGGVQWTQILELVGLSRSDGALQYPVVAEHPDHCVIVGLDGWLFKYWYAERILEAYQNKCMRAAIALREDPTLADAIPRPQEDLRFGVEIEVGGLSVLDARIILQRNSMIGWSVHEDLSITLDSPEKTDGCEVVSPPLAWDRFCEVEKILSLLRKAGAKPTETSGLHVHISGAGLYQRPEAVRRLIALWLAKESTLYAEVLESRAEWCERLSSSQRQIATVVGGIPEMERLWYQGYDEPRGWEKHPSRTVTLNLHRLFWAFGDDKTVEFRVFNGTTSAKEVKSRVAFAMGLVKLALQK